MSLTRNLTIALAPVLLALGGCTTGLPTQVSRFQAMPAPQGQTFAIQAADPHNQGGLEFGQYAAVVREHLAHQGYREAPSAGDADLVVSLDYGVDNGQTRIRSYPSAFGHSGYGYFGRPYYWGWHDPFFDSGFDRDIESYTLFTSFVDVDIKRTSDGQSVFEGTAKARSRTDELPRLVPPLLEAMFTGFPGNSGETVRITVPNAPSNSAAR